MTKRTQIEMEFGEPLFDVLAGFAAMGYSRSDTAGILGYDRPHFTRYLLPQVDPEQRIPWPGRGYSVAALEAVRRRSGNLSWRHAVSLAARRRWAMQAGKEELVG